MTNRTHQPSHVEQATAEAIDVLNQALRVAHHKYALQADGIGETEFRRIVAGYLERMTFAEMLEVLEVAPTDLDKQASTRTAHDN